MSRVGVPDVGHMGWRSDGVTAPSAPRQSLDDERRGLAGGFVAVPPDARNIVLWKSPNS